VYFSFGSFVLGLIENFHPSVPTMVGILYEPGPGIAFLKASEGCSFRYTLEYASQAIPKLKAFEPGFFTKSDAN